MHVRLCCWCLTKLRSRSTVQNHSSEFWGLLECPKSKINDMTTFRKAWNRTATAWHLCSQSWRHNACAILAFSRGFLLRWSVGYLHHLSGSWIGIYLSSEDCHLAPQPSQGNVRLQWIRALASSISGDSLTKKPTLLELPVDLDPVAGSTRMVSDGHQPVLVVAAVNRAFKAGERRRLHHPVTHGIMWMKSLEKKVCFYRWIS